MNHNLKSFGSDEIIKDLTEEDFLYSVGFSYGIGDGNDRSEDAIESDAADLEDHIISCNQVI